MASFGKYKIQKEVISNQKQPSCKKRCGQAATNSSELSLLKFLPLTYHHSHFLAATLDFTSFFTLAFLGAAPYFTAKLFLIRFTLFLNTLDLKQIFIIHVAVQIHYFSQLHNIVCTS